MSVSFGRRVVAAMSAALLMALIAAQSSVQAADEKAEKTTKTAATEKTPAKAAEKTETITKTAETKPGALIDLNTATLEELQTLPLIGKVSAEKIIAGRPYASVADLPKSKLLESTIEKITPLVTVKAAKAPAVTETNAPPKGKKTAKAKATKKADDKPAAMPPTKGMVWANVETKVYHTEGSRWYGKTKNGKWMTKEDAEKEGYRLGKN